MKQYLDLLENILKNGHKKEDRTGTGTISIFGPQMEFDLKNGFPLVTTKKIHLKSIIHELLWLLSGDTNIKYLNDNGVRIWNEWADDNELGPIYGKQWRSWGSRKIIVPDGNNGYKYESDDLGIDQINNVINLLKTNPDSRRILVSAWNVKDLPDENISPQENVRIDKSALPPCHLLFQFYTRIATFEERVQYASLILNEDIRSGGCKRAIELLDLLNVPTRMISLKMYQR